MGVLHGNRDRVEPPGPNLVKSRDPLADPIALRRGACHLVIITWPYPFSFADKLCLWLHLWLRRLFSFLGYSPAVYACSQDLLKICHMTSVTGLVEMGSAHSHGGEMSIDIRRLAHASELSSVVIRRQNTQNTDVCSENPVTRYINAFLRTSMGCISYRNIHTSIGIHFGHDGMDPIFVIRVPVNVHAECVWAILRNLYKRKQYRKYIAYE